MHTCSGCQQSFEDERPRPRLCPTCKAERIKQRDRERGQDPARKALVKARAHRYADSKRQKKWIARNPEKRKAHITLNNAVRDGRIIKPTICSACEQERKITAHHDDYAQPLVVRWLCTECHGAEHRALNEQTRAA